MIKSVGTLLILIFSLYCHSSSHPSDAELETFFKSHKPEFVQLTSMLIEDRDIVRLTPENVFFSDDSIKQLPSDRLSEYRNLFKKLNLENGIHRDNLTSIRFIASTKGFPVATSEKSFLYSTEKLSPIRDSLDQFELKADQPQIFKKIDENWYLVFESW